VITYLDASALVKLVARERESTALRAHLRRHRGDDMVTSALSRTEVVRAVLAGGPEAVAQARRVLARLAQVAVDAVVLDDAGTLSAPGLLRSLDAVHLASARQFGADLREIVTYDARMSAAATSIGIVVAAPA
jgi:predicted nucleic acid-binding protein